MNGSVPVHASLAYTTAAAADAFDPFDFDLFTALARDSPPSLASAEQVPRPPLPLSPPSPMFRRSLDPASLPGVVAIKLLRILGAAPLVNRQSNRRPTVCLALSTQDSSPSASGQPGSGGQPGSWGVPCASFHNYAAQLDGLANDLWELTPPVAQPGTCSNIPAKALHTEPTAPVVHCVLTARRRLPFL